MFLQVFLAIVVIFVIYFLYLYKKIHFCFEAAGLKYLPGVPIFGNKLKSVFLRRHFVYDLEEVYNAFPDEKYVGFIDGTIPRILVRDPDLMKTIVIKDFDHFHDRKDVFPIILDPMLARNIDQLKGEEWKSMRSAMTPAFTGARLRFMMPTIKNVCKNIVKTIRESPSNEVDISYFMSRCTLDAAIAAAFGYNRETAGLEKSTLFKLASDINFTLWKRVLVFLSLQNTVLRDIFKKLGFQLFPKKIHDFVREFVLKSLEYRKKHNISMLDYMDVFCKKSEEKPIEDFAGQVLFAILASIETASNKLCFCFLELAHHPDIQERLYQEIRKSEEEGQLTLEGINGLKYLDCVFKEVSRKWSAAVMMDRVCTKPYLLPPPREGGKPYLVKPGMMLFNVVNNVHMDPEYHPNPEAFNPERFSDENRPNMKPFTFMPFGMGPRNCLGGRFVILKLKVIIYYMVLNFKLEKCEKTPDSFVLEPDDLLSVKPKGGSWLKLEPRF